MDTEDDAIIIASMWPRAEAHGNLREPLLPGFGYYVLQCGRGPKPTEILFGNMTMEIYQQLQCGRGPKPTEI